MALLAGTWSFTQWMDALNSLLSGTTAVSSTPYTMLATDSLILVDATGGAATVDVIAIASHRGSKVTVKKIDSSGNSVTVDGDGSETFDGVTTVVLAAQYDSVTFQHDGTEWWITSTT